MVARGPVAPLSQTGGGQRDERVRRGARAIDPTARRTAARVQELAAAGSRLFRPWPESPSAGLRPAAQRDDPLARAGLLGAGHLTCIRAHLRVASQLRVRYRWTTGQAARRMGVRVGDLSLQHEADCAGERAERRRRGGLSRRRMPDQRTRRAHA